MLTAAELAQMRTMQNRRFDLTATITRPTKINDGQGGRLPGVPTTFTSPCCVAPHKSAQGEEVVAAAVQGQGLWDITFPAQTDVRLTDKIAIGDRSFEVTSLYAPKSRETARMVLCVERKP